MKHLVISFLDQIANIGGSTFSCTAVNLSTTVTQMTITMGTMSTTNSSIEDILGYSYEDFETDAVRVCIYYCYLGVAMFLAASIQVTLLINS
jgi:hypothetical protein